MTAKAKHSTSATQCPSPLVLFGIDSRGKPKAARFGKEHASLAMKAATQLQLQRSGQQRPKGRRDCRSAAGWPGSCDRPHVRAVHSPRPLRQAGRRRCERKRPSAKPAGKRVLRGAAGSKPPAARRPTCRGIGSEIGVGDLVVAQEESGRMAGTRQSSSKPTATCSRCAGVTTRGNAGLCAIGCGSACSIPGPEPSAENGQISESLGPDKARQTGRSGPRHQPFAAQGLGRD